MDDEELAENILRTWLDFLVQGNFKEIAALTVDSELTIMRTQWNDVELYLNLTSSAFVMVVQSTSMQEFIRSGLNNICKGHFFDQNYNVISPVPIEFRIKLLDSEESWRDIVKDIIVNSLDANQGTITKKVFARKGKSPHTYNEMSFGSQTEVRIAQELERLGVLFFPLPLAVRYETGNMYQDHREPDFLVCHDGVWGILEVSYHPDRYEKDAEKDHWFQRAGLLCVRHYTAERCFREPDVVVREFMEVLAKHKR